MYLKFKTAILAVGLAALLAACVTTGLKPGDTPPMSRAKATALKAPIYGVDIAAANGPAAKKALSDAFMKIYNNTPTDTRYGNPRVIEENDRGFRIRSNRATASVGTVQPPDIEIVFFLEEIPGQPAQVKANTYFVAIQNPGNDELRFSYDNIGFMNEDNNKRMMDQILPQVQQQFSRQRVTLLPTPPAAALSISPARTADMIKLEQLFLGGDREGMRQHARGMADAGNSVAQCAMAYADFVGLGGAKNEDSARQWLDKSLAANDAVCKAAADLYGWGRKQDTVAAVNALRVSAEAGNLHALYILGWIAWDSSRNDKALVLTAAQLWSAAARLGLSGLDRHLEEATKNLSPEDRARAQTYAGQWRLWAPRQI
jgi:hypothetical protein